MWKAIGKWLLQNVVKEIVQDVLEQQLNKQVTEKRKDV